MLTIRMRTLMAGPAGVRRPGDVFEPASMGEAKALVAGGFAEVVGGEIETATARTVKENAAVRTGKPPQVPPPAKPKPPATSKNDD